MKLKQITVLCVFVVMIQQDSFMSLCDITLVSLQTANSSRTAVTCVHLQVFVLFCFRPGEFSRLFLNFLC